MKKIIYLGLLSLLSLNFESASAQEKGAKEVTGGDQFAGFTNGEIVCSENLKPLGTALRKNTEAYDNYIIGVFQRTPVVDANGDMFYSKKIPIVRDGICDLKYNAEGGVIKKGDALTSSSEAGVAMKATKAGIILGVALEDANVTTGLVKTRVMIQYIKQ